MSSRRVVRLFYYYRNGEIVYSDSDLGPQVVKKWSASRRLSEVLSGNHAQDMSASYVFPKRT